MKKMTNAEHSLKRITSMRHMIVLEGLLVGVFAGAVSVFYRFILARAEDWNGSVLAWVGKSPSRLVIWLAILAGLSVIVAKILQWEPMCSGSGIPQVEGEIQNSLKSNCVKIILGKLLGGFLCIFGGLALGREGPSVQLGAMTGKSISRLFKRIKVEERFLLTCGASAGLSAAFNAPLAGAMFALEEIHKNFSPLVMMSAMAASAIADFLSRTVFGFDPIFDFGQLSYIRMRYYPLVVVLGILTGVLGVVYNKCLLKSQDLYQKIPMKKSEYKVIIPFLLAGLLGVTTPEVLGGGHGMIRLISAGHLTLRIVVFLLAVKFLFSMVSFGSGAPGGIFFPMLVLGAYIGGTFGLITAQIFGFDVSLVQDFVVLAMASYFTAIVRAPMTGIILICEMTGSFTHILALSLVSVTAYITADILKSTPVYESLLWRLLRKVGKVKGEEKKGEKGEKIIVETPVEQGSFADGKCIKDIPFPKDSLIIEIMRGEQELMPKGDTRLQPRDVLVIMYNEFDEVAAHDAIMELTSLQGRTP
jgi:H+/Cl- antiporter ClcA